MRKFLLLSVFVCLSFFASAQFSLVAPAYTQDFNSSLVTSGTGTSASLPTGWAFNETGGNANTTYTAGSGTANAGDTYSFGTGTNSDRAFGGLLSGSLNPTIGFYVTNNTGSIITSLTITYTGEQWRLGALSRVDRMDFEYSQDATSLTTGNWVDVDALDFTAPVTSGTIGALDGNNALNRTSISSTITGLNIPNGTSFFIRWSDLNASGSDDGLGIDDFSLTAGFTAASTNYFRSVQTGPWSSTSTWESSPDNITWSAATTVPNSASSGITIRNGHIVTFAAFISVDQLVIQGGGTLNFTSGIMTINDGTGIDIDIEGAAAFVLSSASNPPVFSGSPVINVQSGGIVRVSAAGLTTTANAGVHASNFVYNNSAILEYTISTPFGSDNITYFPGVAANIIPIFRITQTISGLVGSTNPTVINGIFEANGDVTFTASGTKTFRNGIRGSGTIAENSSGKFIINGTTAELGGTGGLAVPATGGLEIGPSTAVTMITSKGVSGNITLFSNTYVTLGTYNLSVTGNVSGGSSNSYIKTDDTGGFITLGLNGTKVLPLGNSTYNPLTITHTGALNWTVRVEDVLTVDDPVFASNVAKAVLREWHITPSTNPPATGATLVFQWDDNDPSQVGGSYSNTENVQVWHEVANGNPWGNDWIAAGVAQVAGGFPGPGIRTATISGWTWFSPFAVSNISGPLPLKLISFEAIKMNTGTAKLWWEMAGCCAPGAKFELERSYNGSNFAIVSAIEGSTTSRFYTTTDALNTTGATYYRLKMTDADGKISFSKVVAIVTEKEGFLLTTVYPNPATDKVTVSAGAAHKTIVSCQLVNISGAVVKKWTTILNEGPNTIQIDTRTLAPGIYYLQAEDQQHRVVVSFVKQ